MRIAKAFLSLLTIPIVPVSLISAGMAMDAVWPADSRLVIVFMASEITAGTRAPGHDGYGPYRRSDDRESRSVEEITEVSEHHATGGRRAGIRLAKGPDAAAA
jgi:hypothetical protein